MRTRRGVTVVNGGPQLLQHGNIFITQFRDGMVHATDPSFAYGWALQRNPRTFAAVDSKGRTVLVTVGRPAADRELSAFPRRLGCVRSARREDHRGSRCRFTCTARNAAMRWSSGWRTC